MPTTAAAAHTPAYPRAAFADTVGLISLRDAAVNVLEKPLEDTHIAVHEDVYLVVGARGLNRVDDGAGSRGGGAGGRAGFDLARV